jgi:hypothetical protein
MKLTCEFHPSYGLYLANVNSKGSAFKRVLD